ncbi:MAG: histidine phosphatase family protein [Acidimicrobiales bacterium]
MKLHIVRHAQAGKKAQWKGDDDERPLSPLGVAQACELGEVLPKVRRLIASPTVRCHQTLEPLAERLGLEIEDDRALCKTTSLTKTLTLLDELIDGGQNVAVCSHGEVLGPLMHELETTGVTLVGDGPANQKGSVWTVKVTKGDMIKATYRHPPHVSVKS